MSPSGANAVGSTSINPLLGILATLLGGAAGGFPSPTSTTTSGSGTTDQWQNQASDLSSATQLQNLLNTLQQITGQTSNIQTSTPNLSPNSQNFIDSLMQKYQSIQSPSMTGYVAGQTSNINTNADAQQKAVANIMASRGLSTSPVAATSAANIDQNRINQITGVQQQAPLLAHQFNLQNLGAATGLAGMLPGLSGVTTTGGTTNAQNTVGSQTQSQRQETQQQTANQMVGQNNNVSNQQQQQNKGGGIGGILGGIGSMLLPLLMLSDKRLKKDIHPVNYAVSKIKELKPSTWKWKGGEVQDMGFIAQDVEKILPSLVHSDKSTGVELKRVNYAGIIPLLVSAVQDLDRRTSDGSGRS